MAGEGESHRLLLCLLRDKKIPMWSANQVLEATVSALVITLWYLLSEPRLVINSPPLSTLMLMLLARPHRWVRWDSTEMTFKPQWRRTW